MAASVIEVGAFEKIEALAADQELPAAGQNGMLFAVDAKHIVSRGPW